MLSLKQEDGEDIQMLAEKLWKVVSHAFQRVELQTVYLEKQFVICFIDAVHERSVKTKLLRKELKTFSEFTKVAIEVERFI